MYEAARSTEPLPTQFRCPMLVPDVDGAADTEITMAGRTFMATCPPPPQWTRLAPFIDIDGLIRPEDWDAAMRTAASRAFQHFLAACMPLDDVKKMARAVRHGLLPDAELLAAVRRLMSAWWTDKAVIMMAEIAA